MGDTLLSSDVNEVQDILAGRSKYIIFYLQNFCCCILNWKGKRYTILFNIENLDFVIFNGIYDIGTRQNIHAIDISLRLEFQLIIRELEAKDARESFLNLDLPFSYCVFWTTYIILNTLQRIRNQGLDIYYRVWMRFIAFSSTQIERIQLHSWKLSTLFSDECPVHFSRYIVG